MPTWVSRHEDSIVPPTLLALDSPNHYTVAWIAALPIERAAAEAMLDEIHAIPAGFSKHHTDKNVYTWGRMGQHNIVIACLTAGVYGTTSAATTASNLLASLPSVRIGLLVGIGGGIARPDEGRDIRLGDVVVSQPDGTTGGVCQYDLSKAKLGSKRERKGFLKPPPDVLLNALSCIQARHLLEDSKIPDFVQEMPKKYPKMGRKSRKSPGFAYQGTENDRLFQASYDHVPGPGCQNCVAAGEVQRDARDSTDPEIHYGIIASGNTLVKDAATRDQIIRDVGEDCLCFEMEAAGLMNQFPCVVIRGICDYADSHKNDMWQQYAAATAAAYGKELLLYVPVTEVRETERAFDVLQSVCHITGHVLTVYIYAVDHKLDRLQQTTAAFVSNSIAKRHADNIRAWLQPPDTSSNENQARKLRHGGTGMWLLGHPAFQSWCAGSRQYLGLLGVTGCGKTILSTTVLDHLVLRGDRRVLRFFFDFSDGQKRTLDGMLRSLAFQLYQNTTTGAELLDKLFNNHGDGRHQPPMKAVSDVVYEMLAADTMVCIVLDALDEAANRRELLDWIEDISSRPDLTHVRLLCTARPEPEFLAGSSLMIRKNSWILLRREAVNADIRAYVAGQLADRWDFQVKRLPQDLIEQIVAEVGGGADGSFRWAACQVNSLAECRTPNMIRDALRNPPKDLGEMYERMLSKIPAHSKGDAMRLLHFLLQASRPLLVEEAIDILATDTRTQRPSFDKNRRVFGENDVLYFCPSLVSIIEVSQLVNVRSVGGGDQLVTVIRKELHLAHFSVEEYLHSLARFHPFVSSIAITKTCLTYLRAVSGDLKTINDEYPFAQLAARKWARYAAYTQSWEEVFQTSLAFIKDEQTFQRWCHLDQDDVYQHHMVRRSPSQGSRLYYACLKGLTRVAQELIRGGMNVNAEGGVYGNALQAASSGGHIDTVALLLVKGADANASGGHYGTALSAASSHGNINVLRLLIAKGADIGARGGAEGNALQAASEAGHLDIVKLLVEMGADVNTPFSNVHYEDALTAASARGYTHIVELLLANGARVNAGNALRAASHRGHTLVAEQLLLEHGADASIRSGFYDGALQAASYHGHGDIVEVLIRACADRDTQGGYAPGLHFGSALQSAIRGRRLSIAKLLVDKGATIHTLNDDALDMVSAYGWGDLVKLLLERGAEVSAENSTRALRSAACRGHLEVVVILLDSGAVIGDSLSSAVKGSHEDIARLLLDRGAEVETSAIWAAASRGLCGIVELLLEKRPDLEAQNGDLDFALRAAVSRGHSNVVRLLLKKGVSANAPMDDEYGNALQFASWIGRSDIAKLLV
ncbi:ankyrin repeat-containing domain protein [Plectosphaerella plurivora]|uniref:Ankyrin repeat-containing domain protein n=1 Tax=Plectosphaerella plurivora TaxID=936078 RepID=A0A9P8VIY8_9PEZI|nr:ankyrin repeat-containing domain protein [Plectosphaerella plurivora]